MSLNLEKLKYDDRGLIPAIVQDAGSGAVLMMAYMNEESLRISLNEGRTCFYSRSRAELWRKGETSGNVQHIKSITADCDYDTLLITVQKEGPACHLGTQSCFQYAIEGRPPIECAQNENLRDAGFHIDKLFALIEERKQKLPGGSYTTYLFEKGREKILKKLGEECAEVIIAAMKGDRDETVYEMGDLCYHALVLLCDMGLTPAMVRAELDKRHIIDHKVKQERMG